MHVFIIPDANRRWAEKNQQSPFAGHAAGAVAFERILSEALELSVSHLTGWALSVDNIKKRSKAEVRFLFNLLTDYFIKLAASEEVQDRGVCVKAIGEWRRYCPAELKQAIELCTDKTAHHKNLVLTVLIAYSGTEEMTSAISGMVTDARARTVDSSCIKNYLWTRDLPVVDLTIRTGGEPHLSDGALMWLMANTHFYFTDTFWPDFSREEFRNAIDEFRAKERRYGR